MNLKEMLIGLDGLKAKGNIDIEITGIAFNSKEVQKGYLFVAIKGFETDGHEYIKEDNTEEIDKENTNVKEQTPSAGIVVNKGSNIYLKIK